MMLVLRPSGVAVLSLNVNGGVNALSSEVLGHFDNSLDFIAKEDSVKALILTSGKTNQFLVGADIKEILKITESEEALKLAERGQNAFKKVLTSKRPVVAAINGLCLGGGLELAICCDARIATATEQTLLGLPEVNIGLVPGLGGTQRLLRLIGLKAALELILGAEPISVWQAMNVGLIDRLSAPETLLQEAESTALELLKSPLARQAGRKELEEQAEQKDGGQQKRLSLLKMSDRAVRMRTKGHYPAPKKALEVIEKGLSEGIEAGLKAERHAFAELAASAISKHLINVYISKEMAVQLAGRAIDQCGTVTTLGIIGTSTMGSSISELALSKGIDVLLKGSTPEKADVHARRLNKKFEAQKSEFETKANESAASGQSGNILAPPAAKFAKVEVAATDDDMRPAEIIIETVTEDLDLKNKIIYELSRVMKGDCIIASNTSSFAISNLSQFSNKPERIIGLHFFNPVERMPLVEIITHERTDANVLKRATALVGQLGKIPITVKDSPGFLVNRLLTWYMLETSRMMTEGVPLNWVEDIAAGFGMPIPPMVLYDELGWRLSASVVSMLQEKLGTRYTTAQVMHRGLALGNVDGKKTNAGWYLFDDGGKRTGFNRRVCENAGVNFSDEKPSSETEELIRNRLFLPMIDEAARCLEERVVRKARDIDLALVMGVGFPPFRGGLLRYADDLGMDYVVARLEEIYERFEPKRTISNMIRSLHSEKRRFYGLGQSS